ncbi:23S rRNA (uracil(1939)-C(5))-methyltransferase RlmD [Lactococcus nasutitermitis]|uniref:23S rRNA (Uracil(1939)-C(5))-methyltransferase RlmD n=1 Tax=Lactococcus nasutitermitis TaxID=1652957 RepID=A0ABV9JDC8_9LACT|nr:23S rRNA (uracil(1939)-C(5))-methyltransferase RlmD [Lactococcus nasutitermitis]
MVNFKKNDVFEADVIDLTHEGQGVVKIDGFTFFVDNALPDEKIKMRVTKVGKSFGFGRVEEMIKSTDKRVSGLNVDYLRTGIADLGHLIYSEQLIYKRQQVVELLKKTARKVDFPVAETLGAKETVAYRNKAQVPVRMINGELTTGFYRKNSHDLIPIEDFYIQAPEIDALIKFLRDKFRVLKISAYDEKKRQGWLRNIVVRRGFHSAEMMLALVVTSDKIPFDKVKFLSDLLESFPELKSVQLNINRSEGSFILGKKFLTLFGEDFITDTMLGKKFEISAAAFYQVNTAQAENLYTIAYDFAELSSSDVVIDAYSGIGTIGLAMSDKVAEIYGMEVVPAAVENAKHNALLNGVKNAHYEVGSAEMVMPKWKNAGIKADVIFVDPPRKGLDDSFIETATAMSARAIIYISCNPATFARDVVRIEERGYLLKKVQPVDLFPQTHHVELVARFERV